MPDVPYHAWTHRPKAQGGTDPIESEGGETFGQWCRVWKTANQTVTSGNGDVVTFEAAKNLYTGYFGTSDAEGFGTAGDSITILQSGLYAFTYRLYLDDLPDVPFSANMNGIDWNRQLYYESTFDPAALTGFGAHDSYIFRSDELYGQTPPEMYLIADVPAASTTNLVIHRGTLSPTNLTSNATYMEIIRIGPGLNTGNPNAV